MTSQYEGFPNTLVEAMAHGLPAVSYDCDTGPRDIIRHGVDGILVPEADLAALSRTLTALLGDSDCRKRLGQRALEVRERFSESSVMRKWKELFEQLGLRPE